MAQNPLPTQRSESAGGVAYRRGESQVEVVLISVGPENRWQLPKGNIDPGETAEQAAVREVREEGGVETKLLTPLDTIDYYFFTGQGKWRTRHHKYVHFYLMEYQGGDPKDHDYEVNEACWVEIHQAVQMLAFEGEKHMVELAIQRISSTE